MSDCLFCKIIEKKVPSKIVFEDDRCIAFSDSHPQAPVHILIVPKRHVPTLVDYTDKDAEEIGYIHLIANRIAREKKLDESGFRTVFNCKSAGGQMVYHVHLHLLGGRQMTWPPG
ncbi:MAG: histidine triad nucleotide-binding protein [Nitrospirae bacterium]|nr:histidine triad nucleotide-binding protein [Nitrospirota bacterium]